MTIPSSTRVAPAEGPIVAADLAETARDLALVLPDLASRAERSGLHLVAQHLNKALELAQRVAAAGPPPPSR